MVSIHDERFGNDKNLSVHYDAENESYFIIDSITGDTVSIVDEYSYIGDRRRQEEIDAEIEEEIEAYDTGSMDEYALYIS